MKKFVITAILAVLFSSGSALIAQDRQEGYLGLPGDNLNLYAVMKLFQESKTLEEFERNLNDQNSNINNLDLNNDNQVDYIKVFDDIDGDVHNIVLQVAVGPKENQDVAVFTVQRFNNGQVQIQLTGDEELYGKDYIIEPRIDDASSETPNPGYSGQAITYYRTTPVEIAAWPIVRFVYLPSYTRWHSSWDWGYYPTYWHPWHPFSYHYYYGYHYNWYNDYYGHYRQWNYHRYSRWNDFYFRNTRAYSPEVSHRIQTGVYKTTYSHPEQRREGEAVFAKSHPEQIRRSTDRKLDNSSHPMNNNNSGRPMNNNTDRRSTTTVTNRTVVSHPTDRNMNTDTKRSSTNVTNRTVTNPSPNRSNPAVNRSVSHPESVNRSVSHPESSNRSVNNSSNPSTNSTVTTKRTVTNRSESTPAARSNNANNNQRTNSASSSSRKKAESKSVKKPESIKNPDNNSEHRR
jgi:hypothetical protein